MNRLTLLLAEYQELCHDWRMRDGYMEAKFTNAAFVFSAITLLFFIFTGRTSDGGASGLIPWIIIFSLASLYTFIMLISISKDVYYRDGSMKAATKLQTQIEEHVPATAEEREETEIITKAIELLSIEERLKAKLRECVAAVTTTPLPSCIFEGEEFSDKHGAHSFRKLSPRGGSDVGARFYRRVILNRHTGRWIQAFFLAALVVFLAALVVFLSMFFMLLARA